MSLSIKGMLDKELSGSEVHALNALLNTEILEVEAYNQAIQTIKEADFVPTLEACRNSHARRAAVLKKRVVDLHGNPQETSGFLGNVAKFAGGVASMLSDRATVAILAGSEEFCTQQYQENLKSVDSESFEIAQSDLLPSQGKTEFTAKQLSLQLQVDEQNEHIESNN